MITPENLHVHEMIGLHTKITQSKNPQIIGINGTIINETKKTFTIRTAQCNKIIPKDVAVWQFAIGKIQKEIDGATLVKKPHERLGGRL